jgi:hypothetical protein
MMRILWLCAITFVFWQLALIAKGFANAFCCLQQSENMIANDCQLAKGICAKASGANRQGFYN